MRFGVLMLVTLINQIALAQPGAQFSAQRTQGCPPLVVQFNDQSSGTGIVGWEWDFGNGNGSTLANPSALYSNPGVYSVRLIIEDSLGNFDTLTRTQYITVFTKPTADFEVIDTAFCLYDTAHCINLSNNNGGSPIDSFNWDFGDGNLSNIPNPSKQYNAPGTYTISLFIRNQDGCSDLTIKSRYLEVYSVPQILNMSTNRNFSCAPPYAYRFSHTASNAVSRRWFLGDGNTRTDSIVNYTYSSPGSYSVRLQLETDQGCFADSTLNMSLFNYQIRARYLGPTDTTLCPGEGISFLNQSSTNGSNLAYNWLFGNGMGSSQADPTVTYTQSGTYPVRLIARDPGSNCRDTFEQTLQVTVLADTLEAWISDSFSCSIPFEIHAGLPASVQSVLWQFTPSPTDTSTQLQPHFTYQNWGSYTLRYTYTDTLGCTYTFTKPNAVNLVEPALELEGDTAGCIPFRAHFQYTLAAPNLLSSTQWVLEFFPEEGGVVRDTFTDPDSLNYLFTQAGSGTLTVWGFTQDSCPVIATLPLNFGSPPPTFFDLSEYELCKNDSLFLINLTDTSEISVHRQRWIFMPGGEQSRNWDDTLFIAEADTYSVQLITYHFGCADTLTYEDTLIVKGVNAEWDIQKDACSGLYTLSNQTQGDTRFVWFVNNLPTDSSERIQEYDLTDATEGLLIKLWVINDSIGCHPDSIEFFLEPYYPLRADLSFSDSICAPASVFFSQRYTQGVEPNQADRFFWYVEGREVPVEGSELYQFFANASPLNYVTGHASDFEPEIFFLNKGIYEVSMVSVRQNCYDTATVKVRIPGPEPDFEVQLSGSCMPVEATLISNPLPHEQAYWITGTGDTLTAFDTLRYTYTYFPDTGLYLLEYLLIDSGGCFAWAVQDVPLEAPRIDLSYEQIITCDSAYIVLSAGLSPSEAYTYEWDLDDGSTATASQPHRQYAEEQSHWVYVWVTDSLGCRTFDSIEVLYNPGELKADFEADQRQSDCPPLIVSFTDASQNTLNRPIASWFWTFGDGTASTEQHPSKIYGLPGTYTVSLTITDTAGCSHTHISELGYIEVGGPTATYEISPHLGCIPMDVTFVGRKSLDEYQLFWDLGDGRFEPGDSFTARYNQPGIYIPGVIISDNLGCSYVVPGLEDTLDVRPIPQGDFSLLNPCLNQPNTLVAQGTLDIGTIVQYDWSIEGSDSLLHGDTLHTRFTEAGSREVTLISISDAGCRDTFRAPIDLLGFEPRVESLTDSFFCLGNSLSIRNESTASLNPFQSAWISPEQDTLLETLLELTPEAPGLYTVAHLVYLRDSLGCDTLYKPNITFTIGDTLPFMPNNDLLVVSVLDNERIEMKHNRSQNSEFNSYLIFRVDPNGDWITLRESFQINDTSFIADGLETIHNSYCFAASQSNVCNAVIPTDSAIIHCSINLVSGSDTNVSILEWNPYIGWDSVGGYTVYRMQEGWNEADSIGWVPGHVHRFTDSLDCEPELRTYRVKAEKHGQNTLFSWSDTAQANPPYVNWVPEPHTWYVTVPNNQDLELAWTLPQANRKPLEGYEINRRSRQGSSQSLFSNDLEQTIRTDLENRDVQQSWYHYRIRLWDACSDTGAWSNPARSLWLRVREGANDGAELFWNPYQEWPEGVETYKIEEKLPNGMFVEIGRNAPNDTTFALDIRQLDCGSTLEYRVIAQRNPQNNASVFPYSQDIQSISNHVMPAVSSSVMAPNAFSPNNDGLNDVYKPSVLFMRDYSMKIFNRWGEQLFQTHDCAMGWDGTYIGEGVPDGVYVCMISAVGYDGIKHSIKTHVTLLR